MFAEYEERRCSAGSGREVKCGVENIKAEKTEKEKEFFIVLNQYTQQF